MWGAYIAKVNPGVKGFKRRGTLPHEAVLRDLQRRRICDSTGDTNQLDESSADPVRRKVCGRTAFLHGSVHEKALFQTA